MRLALASGKHLLNLGKSSGGRPWPKGTLQFTTGWAHSLPGMAWWATQVLSSPRVMSMATEQGVLTFAPQREGVTLEQAIVVETAGLHIRRSIST